MVRLVGRLVNGERMKESIRTERQIILDYYVTIVLQFKLFTFR